MHGVRGILNKCFARFILSNRKQFVSINGYKSILADWMSHVGCLKVPYWDLFCSLFLIYINDLYVPIQQLQLHC